MKSALLILDLDETLIYATGKGLEREPDFYCSQYAVYRRPYLNHFLKAVRETYQLAVWTSSSKEYMECVLASIFPKDFQFEFTWSRERCTRVFDLEHQTEAWVKDLKKVKRKGYSLDRILIIDDTQAKLRRNYGNLLRVREWLGSEDDDELRLLVTYLETIRSAESFRRIEKRGWRLEI